VYINPRGAEIIGATAEQIMNFGWVNYLHPEDRDRVYAVWQRTVQASEKFVSEHRFVHENGDIRWTMVQAMPEKVLASMVEHTPIGRMGRPEDIAEAYFWLASEAAGFVSGTVLSVDGGLVIGT
jgi:NAD(P)-dependent dehydrogenase (short-subunit alcohol dehydrogenase family)